MEFFTSTLLCPFIVLEAKTEGRLARQWGKYAGPAKDVFQPSHWMDRHIAKTYLQWLKDLYPEKKIGLIWDHAGPHICEEVLEFAKELGITIEFINKGM